MHSPQSRQRAEDVAAASAAYLLPELPSILRLAAPEAFDRLRNHFQTAIIVFVDGPSEWGLSPCFKEGPAEHNQETLAGEA
jgi:hypothetical protein